VAKQRLALFSQEMARSRPKNVQQLKKICPHVLAQIIGGKTAWKMAVV